MHPSILYFTSSHFECCRYLRNLLEKFCVKIFEHGNNYENSLGTTNTNKKSFWDFYCRCKEVAHYLNGEMGMVFSNLNYSPFPKPKFD